MKTLIQDLRYAARQIRKSPGFSAVAVLTLALGIGGTTAIFSLLNAVMLESVPVRDPDHLLVLKWYARTKPMSGYSSFGDCWDGVGETDQSGCSFSYPMFRHIRSEAKVFSSVAAFAGPAQLNLTGNGGANIVRGELVSGDYFRTLGVESALGRTLEPTDEAPGAEPVAVLSYACWRSAFGGNPSAVGKTVRLNNIPFLIVGVAEPGFTRLTPGKTQDLWLPLTWGQKLDVGWGGPVSVSSDSPENAAGWWLAMVARPKQGIPRAQVEAATNLLFRKALLYGAKPLFKDADKPGIALVPVQQGLTGIRATLKGPLYVLTAVVAVLLLISCSNVAGLMLARATTREREMAVRFALGAARGRIIRQLLTESILLSVIGGVTGVILAFWGAQSLAGFLLANWRSPLALDTHLDARVLVFTAGVSMVAGIALGLIPAFRSTGVDVAPALKENAPTGSIVVGALRGRFRLGDSLVIGQVALSLIVLAISGLLARTLVNLKGIGPGFDARHVLVFGINPTLAGYTEARTQGLYQNLQNRLTAMPGVSSVSYSSVALLNGDLWKGDVHVEGQAPESSAVTQMLAAGPGFFETMRIPLLAGRFVVQSDLNAAHSVAMINESFQKKFFASRNPVGLHLRRKVVDRDVDFEIIGVVADTKYNQLRTPVEPIAYFPVQGGEAYFELRTMINPASLIPVVRQVVRDVDSNLPLVDVRTQSEMVDRLLFTERLVARLSGLFALFALVLVCIGIYGLLSYEVSRRTREIGIRSALGAHPRDVIRLVIGQGIALALAGIAIGVAASFGVTRYLQSMLFGVQPSDPLTYVATALLIVLVALLSCYLPARRAASVDPMVALRYE